MVRLRELLAAPALRSRAHGTDADLDQPVAWAQVVEDAEHAERLLGGELVLTAGAWRRGEGDSERYAAALAAHGAVAVGYVPPEPAHVPEDLQAACARHRLALVELTPRLACEELADAAIDALLAHDGAAHALRRRERTLAAAGDGHGRFAGTLGVLAEELRAPVWLVTGGASFAPPGQPPLGERVLRDVAAGRAAHGGAFELALAGDRTAVALPLPGDAGPSLGHAPDVLVCATARTALRPPRVRLALEQSLRFLALERAAATRERAVRAAASAAVLRRVEEGAAGREELAGLLAALGVEPAGHVVGVVVQAPRAARGELGEIARALEDAADALGAGAVVGATAHGAAALLFAGREGEATDRAVAHASLLLEHQLGRLHATLGASAVIAREPSDVARALLEARQVARLNHLRGPERPLANGRAPERSLAAMLLARDEEASATLHASVLAPLLAYDADHDTELVRTLDVFLSHGGQWTASAQELGVHVNTLRYRLGRIEKVTRRDLGSMAARVDLYAALHARREG